MTKLKLDSYTDFLLQETETLLNIDSPTGYTENAAAWVKEEFEKLGFAVLPSCSNFICAATDRIAAKELYLQLKERGVLIRHFDKPGIDNYSRITIGTREQMDTLLNNVREILEG